MAIRVGRYTLVGKIASGGMAEVFLARIDGPQGFAKRVVLKRILPHLAEDPEFRQRFIGEGRIAALLDHPNITQVYELLDDGTALALVMEHVDAGSLRWLSRALSDRGMTLPWPLLARIGAEACAGLAYAHAFSDADGRPMRIVHRDVSLENVLLSSGGGVKVADFGIATAQGYAALTRSGELIGKPGYMAPERFRGESIDGRADVFAMGVVLWRLATGKAPFDGDDDSAMRRLVLETEPPDLRQIRPEIPAALADAIHEALTKDSAKRPTAEILSRALGRIAATEADGATASGLSSFLRHLRPVAPALPPPVGGDDLSGKQTRRDPAPIAEPSRYGLLAAPTSFVGREEDLRVLDEAFGRSERLITLSGPPGMGKSRLATEFAFRLLEREGRLNAWLCDLAEAEDADDVCAAFGRALEVPMTTGKTHDDTVAQLGHVLAGYGPSLVVFDNFEQVTAHAAATVARWRVMAPHAAFLVTSRERLNLPGEFVRELPALSVPNEEIAVGRSEAVRLFVERTASVRGGWALSPDEEPFVASIATELDGIPLAIELAAARMSLLTPAQLLARLSSRFALLGSARQQRGRHGTLRAAIDWSWDLLSGAEQAALMQCAVFRGGFSLEAAEAVLAAADSLPALELVQALRDKSLLRAYETAEAAGELRLSMYLSIREYAQEKLDASSIASATAARHAAWFLETGARAAAGAEGHDGIRCRRWLALEKENLLAVHRRALSGREPDDARAALHAVLALDPVLAVRGPFVAHLELLDSALSHPAVDSAEGVLRARAYLARGSTRRARGLLVEALQDFQQAADLARTAGDTALAGRALGQQGSVVLDQGQPADARTLLESALASVRKLGDRRTEAVIFETIGRLALEQGRLEDAQRSFEKVMRTAQDVGDRRLRGISLGSLACIHHERGRLDLALSLYAHAIDVLQEVGDRRFEGLFLGYTGLVKWQQGRLDDAAAHVKRSVAVLREIGDRRFEAVFTGALGGVQASDNRIPEATNTLDTADDLLRDMDEVLFREVIELHRGHLDLALGRRSAESGNAEAAAVCRNAATRRAARVLSENLGAAETPRPPASTERDNDIRLALKLLELALARSGVTRPPAG